MSFVRRWHKCIKHQTQSMSQSILSCGLIIIKIFYVFEVCFSKNTTIFHKISGNLPNKDEMCTWKILTGFVFKLIKLFLLVVPLFEKWFALLKIIRRPFYFDHWRRWLDFSHIRHEKNIIILFFTFSTHNFRINSLWFSRTLPINVNIITINWNLEVLELFK